MSLGEIVHGAGGLDLQDAPMHVYNKQRSTAAGDKATIEAPPMAAALTAARGRINTSANLQTISPAVGQRLYPPGRCGEKSIQAQPPRSHTFLVSVIKPSLRYHQN